MNNRQLYYLLRRERENLNREKEVFSLEKQTQELENKKAELWVDIQKRENQNKEVLHNIEIERMHLSNDQYENRMIEIKAQYDSTIQFLEQKMSIFQILEQNKSILHQNEIVKLETINQQERILAQETLVKEQTRQLVYDAHKEKEVVSLIHNHTDNLRRIQKQVTDLQNNNQYYRNRFSEFESIEEKRQLYDKMIKTYNEVKQERLNLMKENMVQKQDFLNKDFDDQLKTLRIISKYRN